MSAQTYEPNAKRDEAINQRLKNMSLHDKVASLFIFHTPGTDPGSITHFLNAYKPGGLILMGDNMPATNGELRDLTQHIKGSSNFPPLLATDEEGGTVKRITSDNYPAGVALANAPVSETTAAFTARSQLLQSDSIPLNFGIIADVTNNPSSFIYPRILGTTPEAASERVVAAVQASRNKTYSTLKHFPGHGETTDDSHVSIPTTDISLDQWRRRDEPPFKAGIDAGADFVMMGHLRYSSIDSEPASLSKKWYDILRGELKFGGIAITDDMFMLQNEPGYSDLAHDAFSALTAGATMLLYVTHNPEGFTDIDPASIIDYVTSEVQTGRLNQKVIDSNARKVLEAEYDSRQFSSQ
jgi:beta-N-acetylhexosaminidase